MVQDSSNLVVILLNVLLKKSFRMKGINLTNTDMEDDIFRAQYFQKRHSVASEINSIPEVNKSVKKLLSTQKLDDFELSYITSLFNFLVKSKYPMSSKELEQVIKSFSL